MKELISDKADVLIESNCWFHRFCKCRGIKFRKCEIRKEKSGECDLNMMLNAIALRANIIFLYSSLSKNNTA